MRKLLLAFLMSMLFACGETDFQKESSKRNSLSGIRYVRSFKTGLCFAVITTDNNEVRNAFTCVPCDSLRNVEVINY